MSNQDNDNIQKISRMLEIGATMLAQHCDACGAPLFRYQGRIMCPVCEDVNDSRSSSGNGSAKKMHSDPADVSSSAKEIKEHVAASVQTPSVDNKTLARSAVNHGYSKHSDPHVSELEDLMFSKMISLAHDMQHEKDVRRIGENLDLIDRCMEILTKMSERF